MGKNDGGEMGTLQHGALIHTDTYWYSMHCASYLKCLNDVSVQDFFVEVNDGFGDGLCVEGIDPVPLGRSGISRVVNRGRETMQNGLLHLAPCHDVVDVGGKAVAALTNCVTKTVLRVNI